MWRFHELVNRLLPYLAPGKKTRKTNLNRDSDSSSMYKTWPLPSRESRDSLPLPTLHRTPAAPHSKNPGLLAHSAAPCPQHLAQVRTSALLLLLGSHGEFMWWIGQNTAPELFPIENKRLKSTLGTYTERVHFFSERWSDFKRLQWSLSHFSSVSFQGPRGTACPPGQSTPGCWAAAGTLMKLRSFLGTFPAKWLHWQPYAREPWHHPSAHWDLRTKWGVITWIIWEMEWVHESYLWSKKITEKNLLQANQYMLVILKGNLHSELSKEDYKPLS